MAFPDVVPTLTDGVVLLRAHRPSDAEGIVAQSNDPASMRWTTVPRPYGMQQAQEFRTLIEDGWNAGTGNLHWAIAGAADPDEYLGTIDLRHGPGGTAEVGFGLHPAGRGRGLMSRAVRLLAGYYFGDLGGHRLYWYAARGNFASWRVAWACGFQHHGLLPQKLAPAPGDPEAVALDAWAASVGADDDLTKPKAPWFEPPTLESDGIRLRGWRDDDLAVAEPHDHPSHHVPERAIPTAETFEAWLMRRRELMSQGTSVNWCIADPATDEPVGEMLVFVHQGSMTDGDTAELGYFLKPSARGRGFASRATRLATAYALSPDGLGLRRLVAETAADNAVSNRILESAGFTRWGHEAQATAPDGSVGPADHWERVRQ
ncbi:MAG: GNAT family N-acetyltransferase [Actinobacteria bacterium]|nr:GNAT family N-acetyltransferase [Actinomycetota bacterium]